MLPRRRPGPVGAPSWQALRSVTSTLPTGPRPSPGSSRVTKSVLCRERRLRRRKPRNRHAVGRGRDVIEADFLAERDRRRIAAMLAADAELDLGARRPAPL